MQRLDFMAALWGVAIRSIKYGAPLEFIGRHGGFGTFKHNFYLLPFSGDWMVVRPLYTAFSVHTQAHLFSLILPTIDGLHLPSNLRKD